MIKLTANQIQHFDEINIDKEVNEKVLRIALTHHCNILNEIIKDEVALWRELAEIHNLDLKNKSYKTALVDGCMCIVEITDEVLDKKGDS